MSQDPNPENSTGSLFITETGTGVWKSYPRDGESEDEALLCNRCISSSIILFVGSMSLVFSAQVDIGPKTVKDGELSSGFAFVFVSFFF